MNAKLTVTRRGKTDEFPMEPQGTTIGRAPSCDVVLASSRVSRRHARIFQDPFGRWIVEDLGSTKGTLVNGNRVQAAAVQPGDTIAVGPFSLAIRERSETQVIPVSWVLSASAVVSDLPSWEIARERTKLTEPLSQPRLHVVNRIIDHLAELGRSCDLYPEVCRSLAGASGIAALVVHVPAAGQPLPESPPVLAYHCSGDDGGLKDQPETRLHLSRRVLEAVRSAGGDVVRASNAAAGEGEFNLTLGDAKMPRTVLCAALSDVTDTVDVLYLDLPAESASPDLGEFVRTIARQADLTRKSLLLAEGRAERQVLDQ